ncbi:hypothetical protein ASG40_17275 [Methylobacterium sp. Leaf399]|nr:hypothetical protein ASG40_17275 [Methylobacterium sp. Leaf399]
MAPACGVSRIGKRLAEAHEEYWALDALPAEDKGVDIRLRMKVLEERQAALEQAISYGRAGSAGGVLAQLCVAYDALGSIKDGFTEDVQENAKARAERCLLSIAAALCAWTGVERMAFGATELMPLRLDALSVLSPEAA